MAVFAAVVPAGAQTALKGEPLAESVLGTYPSGMPGHVLSPLRDRWWRMTPPIGGPLARLRFRSEGVEVVLTLAEFAALSGDVRRLWEYLRREQARRPHHH